MKLFVFSRRTSSAGYTLIEVAVVVVIVGILAAIAVPSWLQFLNSRRIGAVTSDLIQTLKQAQQQAIQERQSIEVQVSSVTLPTVTVDSNAIQLATSSGIRPGMIEMNANSPQALVFDYQGMVRDEKVPLPYKITVKVPGSDRKQCVIVSSLIGSMKTQRDAACD